MMHHIYITLLAHIIVKVWFGLVISKYGVQEVHCASTLALYTVQVHTNRVGEYFATAISFQYKHIYKYTIYTYTFNIHIHYM